jgi:hypothetical protein
LSRTVSAIVTTLGKQTGGELSEGLARQDHGVAPSPDDGGQATAGPDGALVSEVSGDSDFFLLFSSSNIFTVCSSEEVIMSTDFTDQVSDVSDFLTVKTTDITDPTDHRRRGDPLVTAHRSLRGRLAKNH